jgi:hypothetical protein
MTHALKLAPLCLALALAATPLSAQPAQTEQSQPPSAGSAAAPDKNPAPQQPAAGTPAKKSTEATTGSSSPFDYRSSEQISEDVPVSFPVDI